MRIHNRTFLTAVWASHCWREGVSRGKVDCDGCGRSPSLGRSHPTRTVRTITRSPTRSRGTGRRKDQSDRARRARRTIEIGRMRARGHPTAHASFPLRLSHKPAGGARRCVEVTSNPRRAPVRRPAVCVSSDTLGENRSIFCRFSPRVTRAHPKVQRCILARSSLLVNTSQRHGFVRQPRANPTRDGRLRTMSSTKRDDAARRRGEFSRDGVGRRLSPAIDVRRRLNAQRRGTAGASASRVCPGDPRYDYLTRSRD